MILLEVSGHIEDETPIIDSIEPTDEYLTMEMDNTRFNVIAECKEDDNIANIKRKVLRRVQSAIDRRKDY